MHSIFFFIYLDFVEFLDENSRESQTPVEYILSGWVFLPFPIKCVLLEEGSLRR